MLGNLKLHLHIIIPHMTLYDEVEVSNRRKIVVIGSGPIRIGQGIEFDYCTVHAVKTLKKLGIESIIIN